MTTFILVVVVNLAAWCALAWYRYRGGNREDSTLEGVPLTKRQAERSQGHG